MSTISDVAREAGVSVATVSRALRGLDRVNPATRSRVVAAAARLNYVASPTATSLASGRTRVVGVIAPIVNRWFFSTLLSSVGASLREHGYQVLLFDLEEQHSLSRRYLNQSMLWKRVDGLIGLDLPMTDTERDLVRELQLPLISIGAALPGFSSILIDDELASRTLTDYLIALGHRRIGYVGAPPNRGALVQTPADRIQGFTASLADHGLQLREDWICEAPWTAPSAKQAVAAMLRTGDRPTAVVAASDEMAFGVMSQGWDLDLEIGRDLSVVGIDDHELSEVLGLTTQRQDVEGQAQQAVEMLLAALADDEVDIEHRITGTELVVRESSGPPV